MRSCFPGRKKSGYLINSRKIREFNKISGNLNIHKKKNKIYSPPNIADKENFEFILTKHPNVIFMGDFSSKHSYFGCKKQNKKGDNIFDINEDLNLLVVNNDQTESEMFYLT